jgi:putative Holliday junction resolvase
MKYVGVDYGSKRIGLAMSDEDGKLAFPSTIFPNTSHTLVEFQKFIEIYSIEACVIGESVDQDGTPNNIAVSAKAFGEVVKAQLGLPVFYEKEFFTSFEAHGRQGKERFNARQTTYEKPEMLDARAAALILQRFLDKQQKKV